IRPTLREGDSPEAGRAILPDRQQARRGDQRRAGETRTAGALTVVSTLPVFRRRRTMTTGVTIVGTTLALLVLAGAVSAEGFGYPKQGQGQGRFQEDQFEGHNRAPGQTGVNPWP